MVPLYHSITQLLLLLVISYNDPNRMKTEGLWVKKKRQLSFLRC